MDLKDIKAIVDLMKKNSISEFELEKGQEFKIRLKRSARMAARRKKRPCRCICLRARQFRPRWLDSGLPSHSPAPAAASNEIEIKSPMVGTFYRAPSPGSGANYVEIGTEVSADTVVCIIEAMKVMNEIKAEVRGVITQVAGRERQAGRVWPAAIQDSPALRV